MKRRALPRVCCEQFYLILFCWWQKKTNSNYFCVNVCVLEYVADTHVEYSCKIVSNSFPNIYFSLFAFPTENTILRICAQNASNITSFFLEFVQCVCTSPLLLFIKLNLYCFWALVGVRFEWSHVVHNKLHTTQALLQAHSLNYIYVEALSLRSLLWIFISNLNALWLWMTWSCLPWALTVQVHTTLAIVSREQMEIVWKLKCTNEKVTEKKVR